MEFNHKPVLLEKCIDLLNIKPDGTYIDGTLGGAGHAMEIYRRLGKDGLLIGIDRDKNAVEVSKKRLRDMQGEARVIVENANFANMKDVCEKYGIDSVDGILLDLGVSSHQLDEAERGFSYQKDAPLDMRMDRASPLNAEIVVNEYSKEELANIIFKYGEEKWAHRIAEFIAEVRKEKRISTTSQLVSIIKAAIPKRVRRDGPHPAKRTFQAIRIEVNKELEILEQSLSDGFSLLAKGGRFAVITFHSLEDRIVKTSFRKMVNPCTCPPGFPVCVCKKKPEAIHITRKPVTPGPEEIRLNPRSRSSKLRVVEKI